MYEFSVRVYEPPGEAKRSSCILTPIGLKVLVFTMSVKVRYSVPEFISRVNVLIVVNTLSMLNSSIGMIPMLLLFPAVSMMALVLMDITVSSMPVAMSSLTFSVIRLLAFNPITTILVVSPLIALPGNRSIVTVGELREF